MITSNEIFKVDIITKGFKSMTFITFNEDFTYTEIIRELRKYNITF